MRINKCGIKRQINNQIDLRCNKRIFEVLFLFPGICFFCFGIFLRLYFVWMFFVRESPTNYDRLCLYLRTHSHHGLHRQTCCPFYSMRLFEPMPFKQTNLTTITTTAASDNDNDEDDKICCWSLAVDRRRIVNIILTVVRQYLLF